MALLEAARAEAAQATAARAKAAATTAARVKAGTAAVAGVAAEVGAGTAEMAEGARVAAGKEAGMALETEAGRVPGREEGTEAGTEEAREGVGGSGSQLGRKAAVAGTAMARVAAQPRVRWRSSPPPGRGARSAPRSTAEWRSSARSSSTSAGSPQQRRAVASSERRGIVASRIASHAARRGMPSKRLHRSATCEGARPHVTNTTVGPFRGRNSSISSSREPHCEQESAASPPRRRNSLS